MDLPDVPAVGAVADDLERLMRGLSHWSDLRLPNLQALPSVRFHIAAAETSPENPRLAQIHVAVRNVVQNAISRVQYGPTRLALGRLIAFDHPDIGIGERYGTAGDAVGVGKEAMRKGRALRLLKELANEIYHGELIWSQTQESDAVANGRSAFHPAWYRIREIESEIVIDDSHPQVFRGSERRHLLCVGTTQPIVVCTTDLPHDVVTVEMVSGQGRGLHSHRFLGARPADKSGDNLTLLIFDLGLPMQVDDTVDLIWRETAEGYVKDSPCHGYNISSLEFLEKLTIRVKVPSDQIDSPYGRQMKLIDSWLGDPATDARLVTSESLKPDEDGFLNYEVEDVGGRFQFELWWAHRANA